MHGQPTEAQIAAAEHLENAIVAKDARLVELAVTSAFSELHPMHAPALIRLAEVPWHHSHEDVVHLLQMLRSPDAVAALERVTFSKHEYLAYDNNYALARKCTWALADIGSPEAYDSLTRIAKCNDPTIAGYAKKRLENWERELPRKGN